MYTNVWLSNSFDEESRRYSAFTREDIRKLQVLQNKIMRLKCGKGYDASTIELMTATRDLSVHQLGAYTTLLTAHRSIVSGKPKYLSSKLKLRNKTDIPMLPERYQNTMNISSKLTLVRGGFFCRASTLFNRLPLALRLCDDYREFKVDVKEWIKSNVSVKPN